MRTETEEFLGVGPKRKCTYVCVCMHVCTCMYVCMYVCTCTCTCK